MKTRQRLRLTNCRERRGMAAVIMIVMLMVLTLIVVGMVLGQGRDHDLTVRRVETEQAFYAAEAGMNMAVRELMEDNDEDGDGEIGTVSDDGNDANNPSLGTATVLVTAEESGGATVLTSAATAGSSYRQIEASLIGTAGGSPGLLASYYTLGSAPSVLANVDFNAVPTATATVSDINVAASTGSFWSGGPTNNFAAKYTGEVTVASSGTWTFYTRSDDGSKLWINGTQVVNNDGLHGMTTASGTISLSSGSHDIEVQFFEAGGDAGLIVYWSGPGVPSQTVIPSSAFTN